MKYGPLPATLTWHTSSYCNNATCVEVAVTEEFVAVRDSKDRSIEPMIYSPQEWRQFVAGVLDGEFDLPPRFRS